MRFSLSMCSLLKNTAYLRNVNSRCLIQAKLDKLMEANDKRMQDIRQVEHVEIEQLKKEKQALVDELDASK